jgi:hypothetical protein
LSGGNGKLETTKMIKGCFSARCLLRASVLRFKNGERERLLRPANAKDGNKKGSVGK